MNTKYLLDISIDTEFEGKTSISLQVFVKVFKNSDLYSSFCFIVFNSLFSNIFENISFSNFEGHTVYLYWHDFELEPDIETLCFTQVKTSGFAKYKWKKRL